MTLIRTAAITFAAALLFAAPASAGTKDDIRDLQSRLAAAEQALAGQSQAMLKVSQMERQIQDLTGEIERLQYELDQAHTRLDAVSAVLAGDANYQAPGDFSGDMSGGGNAPVSLVPGAGGDPIGDQIQQSSGASQNAPAGDASDVALPLDPNAAFDYASGFLLAGDYPRAKAAFQLYVEAFPNHPRTADAQFRLGEIHLALGENAAAADAFIAHIRNYPNDQRAAEAYLKLGTAFARLDKSTEACTVFKTMKSKHPNAPAPVIQRADLEMARIDCK
ncbi:tol-pal system protein YbgF [Hyphococcus sp.]|jgi:tol-pal system protein YbgF|uniref:tol-pal system protein YbgF n=1 Tax=Hyphococcus sp. TaxID=2038636 RepID=UPI003D126B3F